MLPVLAATVVLTLTALVIRGLAQDLHHEPGSGTAAAAPAVRGGLWSISGAVQSADSGVRAARGIGRSAAGGAIEVRAAAHAVPVASVVQSSGFWIGKTASGRIFVHYDTSASDGGKRRHMPKVGDTVDVRGPVRLAPPNPGQTLKLDARDTAHLTAQGAYINADNVRARCGRC